MGCIPTKPISQLSVVTPKKKRNSKHGIFPIENDEELYLPTENFYEIKTQISRGKFGIVKLAKSKLTQKDVAIKVIVKNNEKDLIEELMILKKIDHPNIIKFIESFQSKKQIFIVTEHCSGGELISSQNNSFDEAYTSRMIFKLLHAVNYLHSLNITHRDIKPENCLLSGDGDLKLIDFGLSAYLPVGERMNGVVGTPSYIAPEVLLGEYGNECDVWSIGIVMHVMLLGKLPFQAKTRQLVLEKVKSGKIHTNTKELQNLSIEARNLLKRFLIKDPFERIKIKDALNSPWFDSIKNEIEVPRGVTEKIEGYCWVDSEKFQIFLVILQFLPDICIDLHKQHFLSLDKEGLGCIQREVKGQCLNLSYSEFLIALFKEELIKEHAKKLYDYCCVNNKFVAPLLEKIVSRRGTFFQHNLLSTEVTSLETFQELLSE